MSPRFTMLNRPDGCWVYLKPPGELALRCACVKVSLYFQHVRDAQVVVRLFLSGKWIVSLLFNAIESVIQIRPFKQVERITAFSIIAAMTQLYSRIGFPKREHVGNSMRNQGGSVWSPNGPISLATRRAEPVPALVQSSNIHLFPEPVLKRYRSILRSFSNEFRYCVCVLCHPLSMALGIGKEKTL